SLAVGVAGHYWQRPARSRRGRWQGGTLQHGAPCADHGVRPRVDMARAGAAAAGGEPGDPVADGRGLAGVGAGAALLRHAVPAGRRRCACASPGADRGIAGARGDGRRIDPGGEDAERPGDDRSRQRWTDHRGAPVRDSGIAAGRRRRAVERLACVAQSSPPACEVVGAAAGAGLPVRVVDRVRQPRHRFRRLLLIDATAGGHRLPAFPPLVTAGACEAVPVELELHNEPLPLSAPFRIAGHVFEAMPATVVTLRDGGHVGRGEAAGVYYNDDHPDAMLATLEALRPRIEAGIDREALRTLLPAGGARTALDGALWELEAQRAGVPVWLLAGLDAVRPLLTTFTVGADDPGVMAERAAAFVQARALKLKLTGEADLDAA